jgi:hypothetical protein
MLLTGEVPVEAEAAGAGFIDELQRACLPLEFGHELIDGIETIHDLSIVTDFAVEAVGGDGHIDGFLMNIHSDEECARFGHVDLRSRV